MLLDILPKLTGVLTTLLNKIPDGDEREKSRVAVDTLLADIAKQANTGQISLNTLEAQNKNIFIAGWRPFIGWVCGIALFWHFLIYPILGTVLLSMSIHVQFIDIDYRNIMNLVLAILGLGGLRTYEKVKLR